MRVVIIAPTEIPSRRANTIQVMKMAQAFVKNGQDVILVSPCSGSRTPESISANSLTGSHSWQNLADHYGLQVQFATDWLPTRRWFRRYDYGISAVRFARQQEADLVFTRLPQAATLAGMFGMPTILEVHDLPQGIMGIRLFRLFLKSSGARRLIVISKILAKDLTEKFDAPQPGPREDSFTLTAPDGVDLERYSDIHDPQTTRKLLKSSVDRSSKKNHALDMLETDIFTAGYTGHLYAGRGTDLILELADRLPEINFLLAGGEPNQVANLAAQVDQRGLNNIILTGFIPNRDLPRYQAACEVLLMPYQKHVAASSGGDISRYLSPMKLFEYMACGRAILSSNLPVLNEILNQTNAVLLPPDEIEAWVSALRMLLMHPEQRYKLAERARSDVQGFSWDIRAARILKGLEL